VYKEAVITNNSREQMCEYLTKIFAWSPNMVMQLKDEMWGYDEVSGDFIYTSTNVWSGTWQGFGEYVQEGMSIVKFREGEACAYYQRDYFTEGDTWIGIPQLSSLIVTIREEYLKIVGATDRCFDADGDGWSKYLTTGCANQGKRDCNDFVAEINPGAEEIPANGLDDDCDGSVDESCATFPVNPERPIQLLPFFLLYLLPAAFVFVAKKRWGRKEMK
jgi:hypothetical protein